MIIKPMLAKSSRPFDSKECPFDKIPYFKRNAFWCRPEMIVIVIFQELTKDRHLSVPVFKGIRDDKTPEECTL